MIVHNAGAVLCVADELAIWDRALSATEASEQFVAAVPEPSAVGALIVAGAGLLARRRRRAR